MQSRFLSIDPGKCGRHGIDDLHGFKTRADHLPDEPHDVLQVVFAVGVAGDAAAGVGVDLVLVDDPFQRRS